MNLFQELKWRESIYDVTDPKIEEVLENEKITFYLGADPTGDSLHVGHLFTYITARRLQNKGHNPIMLIGGATGLIGDPKPGSERQLLTLEQTLENGNAIFKQVSNLIDAKMVNNYDWTSQIDMITFLRDFGKNFNINYMINKDTVKSRLETGISYTEFSYQILQAMDWHHLYKNYNCTLQFGGQDQWGNITSGIELIRKMEGHEAKVYALTIPLITKSDGTKFGKTESGSVWLDPEQTTPYEFYQFWFNTPDQEVIKRLKQFTFLTKEEIENIEEEFNNAPHQRLAQKTLAKEVTTFVHGEDAYNQAIKITQALFSGNISELSGKEIEVGFKDVASITVDEDINIVDALVNVKAASSKREARQFITSNAVSINGEKVNDLEHIVSKDNAIDNKFTVIRRGKKKYYIIKH